LVYIYTVGGSGRTNGKGSGCERWVDAQPVVEGEVYKCVCSGITVVYLAAVSYSSVYVTVASGTC
jgi:hypothetical protein